MPSAEALLFCSFVIMKLSVIIPTYQRPELLIRCIDAIASQSMKPGDYEVIVVTDGPDAGTAAAVQKLVQGYPEHTIKVLATEIKGGPAAARNMGWRNSLGELIAFTDDDCIPDKEWLMSFRDAYVGREHPAIAFTGKTVVPISSPPSDYELNISHLSTADFITANCAVSRNALKEVNGFDERFTMAWREDSDLHFKLMLAGIPVKREPRAVVTHPVRKHNWAVSLKDEKKGIFNVLLYKKYPRLYREKIERNAPLKYYLICISFAIMIAGIFIDDNALTIIGWMLWVGLTCVFVAQRLRRTKRTLPHVMEMVVTSIGIPWLSLYYRLKGSLKYKTLLL